MTQLEAVNSRHSVRRYIHKPLSEEIIVALHSKIDECNSLGNLHIQLVTNETKAFTGVFAYGKFSGVENYLVIAGRKADDLDFRTGYYGEQLVLFAQTLGLNTCWAGLSYRKTDFYEIAEGEKLVLMIALGYGETQGVTHKIKTIEQVSNASADTPEWFINGVKSALLAPTAINQQKFSFEYLGKDESDCHKVRLHKGFSIVGYTQIDSGIAKLHFEIGAGNANYKWV